MKSRALLFGNTGALGTSIQHQLLTDGYDLTVVNRSGVCPDCVTTAVTFDELSQWVSIDKPASFDVVVWAQGVNTNDDLCTISDSELERLFDINVALIVRTCQILHTQGLLASRSRLCIVSSIWETLARSGKLSYTISKASVGGLVRALSSELSANGVVINGVLPGVVDTPMTRSMLDNDQISAVERQTPGGRLVNADEVALAVSLLCSAKNTCITGQSIRLDRGFSHTRMF